MQNYSLPIEIGGKKPICVIRYENVSPGRVHQQPLFRNSERHFIKCQSPLRETSPVNIQRQPIGMSPPQQIRHFSPPQNTNRIYMQRQFVEPNPNKIVHNVFPLPPHGHHRTTS